MSAPEDDDRQLRARLDKLSSALGAQKAAEQEAKARRGRDGELGDAGRGMSLGFRALAELLAGVLVGAAIGWQLDRWLSTTPFLMIVFLLLGMAAGVLNVMRGANASRGSQRDRDGS